MLSALVVLVAMVVVIAFEYFLIGFVTFAFAVSFLRLYVHVRDEDEQRQSEAVSEGFRISRCATILNVAAAANLFLVDVSFRLVDFLPV